MCLFVLWAWVTFFCKLHLLIMSLFTWGIWCDEIFERPGFWIVCEYEYKS